jgi:hypothetical protein
MVCLLADANFWIASKKAALVAGTSVTETTALLVIVDDEERDPSRRRLVGLGRDADRLPAGYDFLPLAQGGDGDASGQ